MCPPFGPVPEVDDGRRTLHERRILAGLRVHTRAHVLALLARHPGLMVTSGYRSPRHNRSVGGAERSWHLLGRAVDLDGPLPLLQAAADTAWAQRISKACTGPVEVLLEHVGQDGEHLHVAW